MTELYNKDSSKYIYRINESEDEIYIFELLFKKFNQKTKKLRLIKNSKSGKLLSSYNKINYCNIKRIFITAIDINNPVNEINIECKLNQNNKHTLILNNNIYIDFYENNGFLESNYNIINI
jgi:hypothetical protein